MKAHDFEVTAHTRTELGTLSGSLFTAPPVMGIDFTPNSSLLAERRLVALHQILVPSEFLFSNFLCPSALDLAGISSERHAVPHKHFPKPFPYQAANADPLARMRLALAIFTLSEGNAPLVALPLL